MYPLYVAVFIIFGSFVPQKIISCGHQLLVKNDSTVVTLGGMIKGLVRLKVQKQLCFNSVTVPGITILVTFEHLKNASFPIVVVVQ